MGNISSSIKKYYLFQFFLSTAFFSPVILLFWQSNGLSMTQIMLLQSFYAISTIILEIPTGVIADKYGNRRSLILGSTILALGFIFYGFCSSFWQFAVCEFILGVGMAFISGADKAFLHQALKLQNKDSEYKKYEGKNQGLAHIGQVIGNLVGGFIGSFWLGGSLIATGVSSLISFTAATTFPKTSFELPRAEQTDYLKVVEESISILKKNKLIIWLTFYTALFSSFIGSVKWLAQPYFLSLDIPVILFGSIYAFFNIFSAATIAFTERIAKIKSIYFITPIIVSILLVLLGVFPSIYLIPLWAVILVLNSMSQIIVTDQVLKYIPGERAATILSFQNLARRFAYIFLGPIIGFLSDEAGLSLTLLYSALIMFCILLFTMYLKARLKVSI